MALRRSILHIAALLVASVGGSAAHAVDPRVQEQMNAPAVQQPLIQAIGEAEYKEAMASGKYRFVGNAKCRLCHREFFVGRKQDAHESALKSISEIPGYDSPKCLPCHTTGFGMPGGFVSYEKTPRLADVQCEGCHGPGSVHVELRTKGGFLAGTDRRPQLRKMCSSCHTSRWNRSFSDLDKAFTKYKHAKPE
jgi:hypothetical protein